MGNNVSPNDGWISTTVAAQRAGRSQSWIYALMKNGQLGAKKVGGRYLVSEKSLAEILNGTPVEAQPA